VSQQSGAVSQEDGQTGADSRAGGSPRTFPTTAGQRCGAKPASRWSRFTLTTKLPSIAFIARPQRLGTTFAPVRGRPISQLRRSPGSLGHWWGLDWSPFSWPVHWHGVTRLVPPTYRTPRRRPRTSEGRTRLACRRVWSCWVLGPCCCTSRRSQRLVVAKASSEARNRSRSNRNSRPSERVKTLEGMNDASAGYCGAVMQGSTVCVRTDESSCRGCLLWAWSRPWCGPRLASAPRPCSWP